MGSGGSSSGGPMLSINHNIDALRNRLWQEMQRRKTQKQIHMNKGYLEGIGKRRKRQAAPSSADASGHDTPAMERSVCCFQRKHFLKKRRTFSN
jgi:hypothetical protein